MKKPPPRKLARPKPNLQQLTVSTNQKTLATKPKAAARGPEETGRTRLSFASAWKDFWSFAGPIITIVGIVGALWPSVTLSTGANIDASQDFQTQFIITNTGKIPVHDIRFNCSLIGNRASIGELSSEGSSLAPISQLNSGVPVSRGCFTKSLNIDGPMLKVEVYYRWPLLNREASTTAYFAVRRGPGGATLVPEATPSPEPPTILRIGYVP